MDRRRFLSSLFAVLALLALASCRHTATPARPPADEHPLPALIVARLQLAREVAWAKARSGAPVHDPEREAAILAGLVAQGRDRGLEPARVETFFTAQIAASRRVQEELLAAWRSGGDRPPHPPLDLREEIRPRLDALTPALLDALAAAPVPSLAAEAERRLAAAGFSPAVIALATAPLRP